MSTLADLLFAIALFSVVLLVPVGAWFDQRRLERRLAQDPANARSRSFAMGIVAQWTAAGLLFAGWQFTTYEPERVFLVPGWSGSEWVAVMLGLLASAAMIVQTHVLREREDQLARVREQLGTIALLAPRTRREQRWFDALSLSAGICEELVYRGLLLGVLASLIGLWPAVLGSTLLFGVAHAYQGARGILRTAIFGAVVALLTVFSGSVYLAMAVHTIVDLSQGRLISMAVRSVNESEAAHGVA